MGHYPQDRNDDNANAFLAGLQKESGSFVEQPTESVTEKAETRRRALQWGAGGVGVAIFLGLRVLRAIARANRNQDKR